MTARSRPARVARAYAVLLGPAPGRMRFWAQTFDIAHSEMVLVKCMTALLTCEHHLVPFTAWRMCWHPGPGRYATGLGCSPA